MSGREGNDDGPRVKVTGRRILQRLNDLMIPEKVCDLLLFFTVSLQSFGALLTSGTSFTLNALLSTVTAFFITQAHLWWRQ